MVDPDIIPKPPESGNPESAETPQPTDVDRIQSETTNEARKRMTLDDFERLSLEDAKYFGNPNRIFFDLQQFANEADQGEKCEVYELSIGHLVKTRKTGMLNLPITHSGSGYIDGEDYLMVAGKHFGIIKEKAKTATNPVLDKVLTYLKSLVINQEKHETMHPYHGKPATDWLKKGGIIQTDEPKEPEKKTPPVTEEPEPAQPPEEEQPPEAQHAQTGAGEGVSTETGVPANTNINVAEGGHVTIHNGPASSVETGGTNPEPPEANPEPTDGNPDKPDASLADFKSYLDQFRAELLADLERRQIELNERERDIGERERAVEGAVTDMRDEHRQNVNEIRQARQQEEDRRRREREEAERNRRDPNDPGRINPNLPSTAGWGPAKSAARRTAEESRHLYNTTHGDGSMWATMMKHVTTDRSKGGAFGDRAVKADPSPTESLEIKKAEGNSQSDEAETQNKATEKSKDESEKKKK